jgi:hypothetical protein
MQESELLEHEEQKDYNGTVGNEEVLPQMPQTPTA